MYLFDIKFINRPISNFLSFITITKLDQLTYNSLNKCVPTLQRYFILSLILIYLPKCVTCSSSSLKSIDARSLAPMYQNLV